jgi:hypothetical protein
MYSSPGYHDQVGRELWFSLLPSSKYNCIDGIKNKPSQERKNKCHCDNWRAGTARSGCDYGDSDSFHTTTSTISYHLGINITE